MQNNKNNLLAASRPFHQMMDGLNTDEHLPMVAISVKSKVSDRSASHAYRFPMVVLLEFQEETHASIFRGNTGSRRVEGTKNWEVVVFVADAEVFCDCVAWRHADTKQKWAAHQEFLDNV